MVTQTRKCLGQSFEGQVVQDISARLDGSPSLENLPAVEQDFVEAMRIIQEMEQKGYLLKSFHAFRLVTVSIDLFLLTFSSIRFASFADQFFPALLVLL